MSEKITNLDKIERERFWIVFDILTNDYTTIQLLKLIKKELDIVLK